MKNFRWTLLPPPFYHSSFNTSLNFLISVLTISFWILHQKAVPKFLRVSSAVVATTKNKCFYHDNTFCKAAPHYLATSGPAVQSQVTHFNTQHVETSFPGELCSITKITVWVLIEGKENAKCPAISWRLTTCFILRLSSLWSKRSIQSLEKAKGTIHQNHHTVQLL